MISKNTSHVDEPLGKKVTTINGHFENLRKWFTPIVLLSLIFMYCFDNNAFSHLDSRFHIKEYDTYLLQKYERIIVFPNIIDNTSKMRFYSQRVLSKLLDIGFFIATREYLN